MNTTGTPASRRVALLFTRFPIATETFLQREVEALRRLHPKLAILSMWPSPPPDRRGPRADHDFSPWHLFSLFWWIPYWTIRSPRVMTRFATTLVQSRLPNPINIWETLLGFGYAISRAHSMEGRYDHLHAVWASAPATAAWALSHLAGIPYSMAGHAYDLFEHGGDGLLEVKIPEAEFIRTSTDVGKRRWVQHGAGASQVHVIRRGILDLPEFIPHKALSSPVRILSVGRLVEKMGYPVLLETLSQLRQAGVEFKATIVGGGPLQQELEIRCRQLGLANRVEFTGALPFGEVTAHLQEADLFLFTGQVARSGDRAGFPNAIGEAMAWGVPVCATAVGAVGEGIRHKETGLIFEEPRQAVEAIIRLLASPHDYEQVRRQARQWVERDFDASENMRHLAALLAG
ncbi:MAG TPA: glycosyltransferase family 4 protein [Oceanipulchritudo sp.]|nr:glycosyltransferase family 4 protein [Oceanipulchritudo sp.]